MSLSQEPIEFSNFEYSDISKNYLSWLNDKDHMKFSQQSQLLHDVDSSRKYIDTFTGTMNKFLAIKRGRVLVGTATIYRSTDHFSCSCGIMIGTEFSGQGIGKLAWNILVTDLARTLKIRKVEAGTQIENIKMISLFKNSGMKFEKVVNEKVSPVERPASFVIYSRLL